MAYEDSSKIQPPLEHVEQLVAVDQSRQDGHKPGQRGSKRSRRRGEIAETLEEKHRLPQPGNDGHIDYRA